MLKELIKIANELDSRGLVKEADALDVLIKAAEGDMRPEEVPIPDRYTCFTDMQNRKDVTFEFFEKIINLMADNPENQEKYHMSPDKIKTLINYMGTLPPGEAGWLLNLVRQAQWDDGVEKKDLLDIDIFDRVEEEPKERFLPFFDDLEESPKKQYLPWDD